MKYGIIAAGEGSRLAHEGVAESKPLVKICGESLVDRLLRIFMDNGATTVAVICNGFMPDVESHLSEISRKGLCGRKVPLELVVRTTPSSMHSFFELSPYLEGGPFCLTTVDTIFREEEFTRYVDTFRREVASGMDGVMGVTGYIDDEKPLYVGTDGNGMINGFYDGPHDCHLISGGIYGLTPSSLGVLRHCVESGQSRMRNFQRALVSAGMRLKAFEFGKVLDIDHAADIAKAERFLEGPAI